ncbi:MAG: hypothetical protein WKF47_05875 [Geodermatophilaceae bacterium]
MTDALRDFLQREELADSDIVGSSMGARMVLENARRGHGGTTVALDPGGFWTDRQRAVFGASVKASVGLVRRVQPLLPALTGNPVTCTALLAQFSHKPWKLPQELVLRELRGFDHSPSLDAALRSLVKGPRQKGAPAGTLQGRVVIGWGRNDKVSVAEPGATRHEPVSGRRTALVRQLRALPAVGSAGGDRANDPERNRLTPPKEIRGNRSWRIAVRSEP